MQKFTEEQEQEEVVTEITKWVDHLYSFGYELDMESDQTNPPMKFGFKNGRNTYKGMIDFYEDEVEVYLSLPNSKHHYSMKESLDEHIEIGWSEQKKEKFTLIDMMDRIKILKELERIGKPS
jgi:hypothetical protein